jgi:histidinol-phosphate aminotransferase
MDRLALRGAVAALQDEAYFQETTAKVVATRDQIMTSLNDLGFIVTDSKANFLLISHPSYPAADLFKQLREQGILVRYFNSPRIDNYLRVTVGTDEEMAQFLAVLKTLIGA